MIENGDSMQLLTDFSTEGQEFGVVLSGRFRTGSGDVESFSYVYSQSEPRDGCPFLKHFGIPFISASIWDKFTIANHIRGRAVGYSLNNSGDWSFPKIRRQRLSYF